MACMAGFLHPHPGDLEEAPGCTLAQPQLRGYLGVYQQMAELCFFFSVVLDFQIISSKKAKLNTFKESTSRLGRVDSWHFTCWLTPHARGSWFQGPALAHNASFLLMQTGRQW